jgi:hypothetical protein
VEFYLLATNVSIFFFVVLGLELRAFTLGHSTSPIFVKGFSRDGLTNYLARLDLNHDPPNLCLLSSQDYRREPLVLGQYFLFNSTTVSAGGELQSWPPNVVLQISTKQARITGLSHHAQLYLPNF